MKIETKRRHIRNNIKEGLKEIKKNRFKTISDLASLIRWTAWVHRDCKELALTYKDSLEESAK